MPILFHPSASAAQRRAAEGRRAAADAAAAAENGAGPAGGSAADADARPQQDGIDADALIDWYARTARALPWREPDAGAWGILVSEVMLQQTQVSRVIDRLVQWLRRWPDPASLAAAEPAEVLRAWDRLGYPQRALNLQRSAALMVQRHGGRVPETVAELLALPGIGDYTARAVAVFAFGQRHPVVDTNTRRVIARAVHGQAAGPSPGKRELVEMEALLPEDEHDSVLFNAAMMELGALVCTARSPACDACPLAASCNWLAAGRPEHGIATTRPQPRYEGSLRQARGLLLQALRDAPAALPEPDLLAAVPDARGPAALASLLADGLASRSPAGIALPGS